MATSETDHPLCSIVLNSSIVAVSHLDHARRKLVEYGHVRSNTEPLVCINVVGPCELSPPGGQMLGTLYLEQMVIFEQPFKWTMYSPLNAFISCSTPSYPMDQDFDIHHIRRQRDCPKSNCEGRLQNFRVYQGKGSVANRHLKGSVVQSVSTPFSCNAH